MVVGRERVECDGHPFAALPMPALELTAGMPPIGPGRCPCGLAHANGAESARQCEKLRIKNHPGAPSTAEDRG
jgi:hypothetical protein